MTALMLRRRAMKPPGSAFSPSDIAGLRLWLKADAITGKVDGDPVAAWTDSSGNGFDAAQTTASKQPLYKANIVNGKPVVRGDGVDDVLATANIGIVEATSWAVVFVFREVSRVETHNIVSLGLQGVDGAVAAVAHGNTNTNIFWNQWGQNFQTLSSGKDFTTGFHIVTARYDGATIVFRADGTQFDSAARVLRLTDNPVRLLGETGGFVGQYGNTDLAEMTLYTTAPSVADLNRVEQHLGDKYAITVA